VKFHLPQQLSRDRLAGNPDRCWPSRVPDHRLRPATGGLPLLHRRGRHVVGPGVGPLPVHRRLGSPLHLRVRRLRHGPARVQRCRRCRVWGRYQSTGASGARFTCESGDCGTGQLACNGAGGAPPATLAEFTLGGGSDLKTDFYDVRNVDGFNLPAAIESAAGGWCQSASCPADINRVCPTELAVRAAPPSSPRNGTAGGVQECVPGVRDGRVLLPRAVRVTGDVQD
jgi:hypothetical protein